MREKAIRGSKRPFSWHTYFANLIEGSRRPRRLGALRPSVPHRSVQDVQLGCEYLTFSVPALMLPGASFQPGWSLSYSQNNGANRPSVPTLNMHKIRFLWPCAFRICIVMLKQKSVILNLARKGMITAAMHQDLFTTLGLDPVPCPTVTHILRETPFTREQLPAQEPAVEPDPSTIDLVITRALSDGPFASVRQLAQRTCLPTSTVCCHLVNTIGSRRNVCLRFLTRCLKAKSSLG
jgi:hypothetical protein